MPTWNTRRYSVDTVSHISCKAEYGIPWHLNKVFIIIYTIFIIVITYLLTGWLTNSPTNRMEGQPNWSIYD